MLTTNVVLAALVQSLTVSAATMMVTVGADNKPQFTPNSITAQPGDMVAFKFIGENHSVASSDADTPCKPQANAIYSDVQTVAASADNSAADNAPTFTVPIVDREPLYIYSSQGQDCQQGMVMIVNPSSAAAVQEYASKAATAGDNVSPKGGVSGGMVVNNAAEKLKGIKARGGVATAAGIVQGIADATGNAGVATAAGILNGIAGAKGGAAAKGGAGAAAKGAAAKGAAAKLGAAKAGKAGAAKGALAALRGGRGKNKQ